MIWGYRYFRKHPYNYSCSFFHFHTWHPRNSARKTCVFFHVQEKKHHHQHPEFRPHFFRNEKYTKGRSQSFLLLQTDHPSSQNPPPLTPTTFTISTQKQHIILTSFFHTQTFHQPVKAIPCPIIQSSKRPQAEAKPCKALASPLRARFERSSPSASGPKSSNAAFKALMDLEGVVGWTVGGLVGWVGWLVGWGLRSRNKNPKFLRKRMMPQQKPTRKLQEKHYKKGERGGMIEAHPLSKMSLISCF